MRLGHVIGKVTLSAADPALKGGRFLLVQPMNKAQLAGAPVLPLASGATVVVYDSLGAGVGQQIGFTEGAEASVPFAEPTPVDAYNALYAAGGDLTFSFHAHDSHGQRCGETAELRRRGAGGRRADALRARCAALAGFAAARAQRRRDEHGRRRAREEGE